MALTDRQRKGYSEMFLHHVFKTKDVHKGMQALYNIFEKMPDRPVAFKEVIDEATKSLPRLANLGDDMNKLPDLKRKKGVRGQQFQTEIPPITPKEVTMINEHPKLKENIESYRRNLLSLSDAFAPLQEKEPQLERLQPKGPGSVAQAASHALSDLGDNPVTRLGASAMDKVAGFFSPHESMTQLQATPPTPPRTPLQRASVAAATGLLGIAIDTQKPSNILGAVTGALLAHAAAPGRDAPKSSQERLEEAASSSSSSSVPVEEIEVGEDEDVPMNALPPKPPQEGYTWYDPRSYFGNVKGPSPNVDPVPREVPKEPDAVPFLSEYEEIPIFGTRPPRYRPSPGFGSRYSFADQPLTSRVSPAVTDILAPRQGFVRGQQPAGGRLAQMAWEGFVVDASAPYAVR